MTDTATPMAEPAQRNPGDVETDPGALTAEQQRRVRALGFARDTLASRGLFAGTDVSKWATDDLLKLADWILDGSDTPGVLFGVSVLPCPGESTGCEPFDPGPVGSEDDETDYLTASPANAERLAQSMAEAKAGSFVDLPPTGALAENDGPSLTEPSGWTDPPATEYQGPRVDFGNASEDDFPR